MWKRPQLASGSAPFAALTNRVSAAPKRRPQQRRPAFVLEGPCAHPHRHAPERGRAAPNRVRYPRRAPRAGFGGVAQPQQRPRRPRRSPPEVAFSEMAHRTRRDGHLVRGRPNSRATTSGRPRRSLRSLPEFRLRRNIALRDRSSPKSSCTYAATESPSTTERPSPTQSPNESPLTRSSEP